MASVNIASRPVLRTHEGAPAKRITAEQELRRSVMACMLWEDSFYEDGKTVNDRIADLAGLVHPDIVSSIAIEARSRFKLRHVPLLLARRLAARKALKAELLSEIIQRPDEITEFLAIYWKDGRQKLAASVKKGIAKAFTKFSQYQLAKYDREGAVCLRDALFLSHAKPKNEEQAKDWKLLVDGKLPIPDTWETQLSGGADKNETFTRLLSENKLGALALLRNLRNMIQSGISDDSIRAGILALKTERVLPFRFISAAKHAPRFEPELGLKMLECMTSRTKLKGKTILLVDVSGSMDSKVSAKSDISRLDAACGVAIIARAMCESVQVFTFSDNLVEVPPREGFALRDSIVHSQRHSSTFLGASVAYINQNYEYDRLVVFTDEQSSDAVPGPKALGYVINIAANKNGIGYGKWMHIDGFSEAVMEFILESEK